MKFTSRSCEAQCTYCLQVVTDETTLISLGINVGDMKEQKLRDGIVHHDLRGKKEQVIIKNIRHIGNEIAGITSQVSRCACNRSILVHRVCSHISEWLRVFLLYSRDRRLALVVLV
jgi:hypothetical protein